jgi:hypothetical protein
MINLIGYKIITTDCKPVAGHRNCRRTFTTISEAKAWQESLQKHASKVQGVPCWVLPSFIIDNPKITNHV